MTASVYQTNTEYVIWDDRPADQWDEAYPVGNGRLGAMPFGAYPQERILINEETVWSRTGRMVMPEDSYEHLEAVRELEAAGDYASVDQYFEENLQGPITADAYQPIGWLRLSYLKTAPLSTTYRELDLRTGIATSVYTLTDGSALQQQVLTSGSDDVVVVSLSSETPFDLAVAIDDGKVKDRDLVVSGAATGQAATRYVMRARVVADEFEALQDTLYVRNANRISLYLAVATDLTRDEAGVKLADDWERKCDLDLDAVARRAADAVVEAAAEDHRSYFDRVGVEFGTTPDAVRSLPTRTRLQRLKDGAQDDPDLIATYFQFGRYLLIASSRPGGFPANLQGVWNPHADPPWASDYHLNINLQMNYWLAETTNLAEMHRPLLDFIRHTQAQGRDMARRLGMRGWCLGHCTDIWANARVMSPKAFWGGSFLSGQWMVMHILEHYRFNRDIRVLEANWDLLAESAAFVESWLIPGPDEDSWMARPSCSPENRFTYQDEYESNKVASLSAGNSYDQFLILQTFNDYVEAARALGREHEAQVVRIKTLLPRVYRPQIGEDGRLMEWRLPFGEDEPGHRHIAHILGAYPGDQIDLEADLPMREAVLHSLLTRLRHGGAGPGWSRAWLMGLFARLSDGAQAYNHLHALLTTATLDNLWDGCEYRGGLAFQIDGNFGATAAIAEMLLHSHGNEIKILPALPVQWQQGRVRGLRARGDYTVDICWQEGVLTDVTIHAGERAYGVVRVSSAGTAVQVSMTPGTTENLAWSDL